MSDVHSVRKHRDANRVIEEWFADMDTVRRKVGLMDDPPEASTSGRVSPQWDSVLSK